MTLLLRAAMRSQHLARRGATAASWATRLVTPAASRECLMDLVFGGPRQGHFTRIPRPHHTWCNMAWLDETRRALYQLCAEFHHIWTKFDRPWHGSGKEPSEFGHQAQSGAKDRTSVTKMAGAPSSWLCKGGGPERPAAAAPRPTASTAALSLRRTSSCFCHSMSTTQSQPQERAAPTTGGGGVSKKTALGQNGYGHTRQRLPRESSRPVAPSFAQLRDLGADFGTESLPPHLGPLSSDLASKSMRNAEERVVMRISGHSGTLCSLRNAECCARARNTRNNAQGRCSPPKEAVLHPRAQ